MENVRKVVIISTIAMFIINFLLSMTPCYHEEKFTFIRTGLLVLMVLMLLFIAGIWVIYVSKEEINLFVFPLFLNFLFIGIAFFFYSTRLPESFLTKEKVGIKFVYCI